MSAKKIIVLILGIFLYSFGISNILNPNNLAPGGVTGISVIINHFTNISLGILVFSFNVPIMLIGIKVFGIKEMAPTFITIAACSVLMDILANLEPLVTEPVLATVYGGLIFGSGLAFILRSGSTTGGSDIIIKLIKIKFPYMETGKLILILDAVIVSMSAIAFGNITVALYAGLTIYISTLMVDKILYGTDGAKMLYIISEHSDEIAKDFLYELSVGVTYLNAIGAYRNDKKLIIMCVMKKTTLPKAREIVKKHDSSAFMIIGNANEILGEGFKSHHSKLL